MARAIAAAVLPDPKPPQKQRNGSREVAKTHYVTVNTIA